MAENYLIWYMKILVFDNYDSFTYNLVHLVEKIIRAKGRCVPE